MAAGLFFCTLAAAAPAGHEAVHENVPPLSHEQAEKANHVTGVHKTASEHAKASEKATHRESPATAGPEGYALTVTPDPKARTGGVLVVKLKKTAGHHGEAIGDVMIWWTTPGGRRSSFPIRPFSEDVWVSRVAVQPEAGENRLSVVILGKNGDGTLGAATELIYVLEAPAMRLRFIERQDPEKTAATSPMPAVAPRAKKKAPASLPAVVLLVTFANVCLLTPGLALARIVKKFPRGKPKRGGVFTQRAATLDPVCGKILAGAGMIDPKSGAPLPWGKSGHTAPKSLFESTMLEPVPDGGADEADPESPAADAMEIRKAADQDEIGEISDKTTIRNAAPLKKLDLNDLSF